jgi:hypothetical protein
LEWRLFSENERDDRYFNKIKIYRYMVNINKTNVNILLYEYSKKQCNFYRAEQNTKQKNVLLYNCYLAALSEFLLSEQIITFKVRHIVSLFIKGLFTFNYKVKFLVEFFK